MRSPTKKILITVIVIIGIPIAWYLISPLFIDKVVDEGFPTQAPALTDPTLAFEPAVATATMAAVQLEENSIIDEPMPVNEDVSMIILAQGDIYDIAHEGMGTATIYQLENGSRVLRFENFEVLNGPQLHVWLTSANPVADTVGTLLPDYFDLGPLKGNIGDQNYPIPDDLDLSQFNSVVIWCVPFRVAFNAAPLVRP